MFIQTFFVHSLMNPKIINEWDLGFELDLTSGWDQVKPLIYY